MIVKKYILAGALCLGMSTQVFAATDAVTNGGFNGPLGAWHFSNPVNRVASNVSNTGIVDTILPGSGTLSQAFHLDAGTYSLDFTGFLFGKGTTLSYSIGGLAATVYSAVAGANHHDFTVAPGGANYTLTFFGTAKGSLLAYASVDNVSVTGVTAVPGPEAGAGLGALALGGMAMWARRRQREHNVAA